MSGEQIDLKLVIKALLDAKGFEEAQAAMKDMGGAANNAKPHIGGLTKELGGSRGAVADMTRVMLQNIGVTGAAGEVAKTAGLAMTSLTGAVNPVVLAATALVAVAALLGPKLIEVANGAEEAAKKQKELADQLMGLLPELRNYIEAVPHASQAARDLAAALEKVEFFKQKQDIRDLREQIKELEKNSKSLGSALATQVSFWKNLGESTEEQRQRFKDEDDQMAATTASLDAARLNLERLIAADAKGVVATEAMTKATEKGRKAREERERKEKEYADWLAHFAAQQKADATADIARNDQLAQNYEKNNKKRLRSDIETTMARLRLKQLELHATEAEYNKTIGYDTDKYLSYKEYTDKKKEANIESTKIGIGLLGQFFGKQKEAAIAQAIVDTYAAAAAAIRPPNPPLPWSAPFLALALATGFAQVANIEGQNFSSGGGFDLPGNDRLAALYGEKWGRDLFHYMDGGLQKERMKSVTNNYHNTYHQGTSVTVPVANMVAGTRAQVEDWFSRTQVRAQRRERKRTI